MLESFIIVLREGFEAFLIVAITLAYLNKSGRKSLRPAVLAGVMAATVVSALLGWVLMRGVNQALWEGILGLVAMALVTSLVVHMWRTGPRMKQEMEQKLGRVTSRPTSKAAFIGVFCFTVVMIAREGMETALMLLQVREGRMLAGALAGLSAAIALSWAWARLGHRVPLRRFFQVTGVFLLLFVVQIGIYTFHEFTEAGVFPASETLHALTEPYSPDGIYGRWFSLGLVMVSASWLFASWLLDRRMLVRSVSPQAGPTR